MAIFSRKAGETPGGSQGANGKWSARSQRSTLQAQELREQLGRCEGLLRYHEGELEKQKVILNATVELSSKGQGMADLYVGRNISAQDFLERQVNAYEAHAQGLKSRIDVLERPTAAQVAERQERQARLAGLAELRLKSLCGNLLPGSEIEALEHGR